MRGHRYQRAKCETCGGTITRQVKGGTENWPDGPHWHAWLHVRNEDWVGNPHNGAPVPESIAEEGS